jgi:hypothetical protein
MPKLPGPPPEPWSMKWIIITIILFMGGYTFLTLHFRKPNRSYEPYNDMKNRGQNHNLLTAGYQRVTLTAAEPTNEQPVEATAQATPAPAGIPLELKNSLFDQPVIPESYQNLRAPASVSGLLASRVIFDCTIADNQQQFVSAYLYVKDNRIFILPEFEKLEGELQSRTRSAHVQLVIPGGAIKPGRYQVVLTGQTASLTWPLQVN